MVAAVELTTTEATGGAWPSLLTLTDAIMLNSCRRRATRREAGVQLRRRVEEGAGGVRGVEKYWTQKQALAPRRAFGVRMRSGRPGAKRRKAS